jgi:GT2 family glycosyltransferase
MKKIFHHWLHCLTKKLSHQPIITHPIPRVVQLIEEKLPSSALLGQNRQPITDKIPYGNIPVTLTSKTCLQFDLVPQEEVITGIQLRFGTYCRVNHCQVTIRLNDYIHRFNASELLDNEPIDIFLPHPQKCLPGQPLRIELYSEDATENNVVAVWCTKILPTFFDSLTLQPFTLPTVSSPQVSIVIPVFNKALYTYNCLLTVQACDPEINKEVIVINNASTDETVDLLQQLQAGFKVIHNSTNQGFVQACRQGARVAAGEWIVFLNNDTQVTPGWLANMIKAMNTDPQIGITGSKLIYPSGWLQEAGGIIFNDASGWNYGRLQDPTDPRFNQSRAVDYCSGASLMIRKNLWEQSGGFDIRYAPAYYEDTDLCFAVRQLGYKVWYCHDSEVVHHEGITSGTDINQGYKAYQLINQKKFQAKWWAILATHFPPPPQTSPELAALRLVTDKPLTFRIPDHKILATHLLGQGWAANFWSYLNLHKVDEELKLIQLMGFNTVIILVPWVGFQTQVNPITYDEDYFTLFKQLLDKVQLHELKVILRLGYTHDNGPHSEPEGFLRQIVVGAEAVMLTAWCNYLERLWNIAQSYPNLLGGFISWEDFFLMDLTHIPLDNRLLFAERTGYQNYLKQHYSLETLAIHYQQAFVSYTEIPIPAFKSSGIQLFSEFWDDLFINKIFKISKQYFPLLTMEVRIDCDPQAESYICHQTTFDISVDTYLTMIYYTPAWGAPNDGQLESADTLLKRLPVLFETVRNQTNNNVIFIDQFNFIDNTPGFERNTGILPQQVAQFLVEVAPILQQQTVGYGLWAWRDVRANALKNGLFERNYPSWNLSQGEIVFDAVEQKKIVLLKSGGTLQQLLSTCFGVPLVKDKLFQLDFKIKPTVAFTQQEPSLLAIYVSYNHQVCYENQVSWRSQDWQAIHLEGLPFGIGYELKLENQGIPLLLADFYLYQHYQENGIIDANGQEKIFYQQFISLNQQLSASQQPSPKTFFRLEEITPSIFNGLFPDRWMGKTLTGIIAKPKELDYFTFIVKAYIPENWPDYHNYLTITLGNQVYCVHHPIGTGYNEIIIDSLTHAEFEPILFLQFEAETVFSPNQYDTYSEDNREVSLLLIEFGFVAHEKINKILTH